MFTQPGALTAALNWYRASNGLDPASNEVQFGDVSVPTVLVWGNKDQAIGRKGCVDAEQYMKGSYKFVELDAGHWLMQEKPEEVATAVLAHLRSHPAT